MNKIYKYNLVILGCILLWTVITRFFYLSNPPEYYFDEVYHAVTAKAYAQNDPAGYEWWHEAPEPGTAYEWLHPPVAKLLMAIGWKYLGQTPWAWRVPGAIAGVMVVAVVYWLALISTNSKAIALSAAGLASLDGLLLTMSRIGMNDIYVTLFMLLAVGCYWKSKSSLNFLNKWLWLSSLWTGIAISTKWSGVFLLGMIGTWELITIFRMKLSWLKRLPVLVVAYGVIPAIIYVGSYGQFWLQDHTWDQFIELHNQIWWYQTNLNATHDYQSKAWEWPLALRPVWMWVDYGDNKQVANIYNQGNPFLFWLGLVVMIYMAVKTAINRKASESVMLILVAYAWSWMPWLFSPRIMFFYHYTPAVPWLAISLGKALNYWWKNRENRVLVWLTWAAVGLSFVYLSPMWFGVFVNQQHASLLFWLPSWK